MTLDVAIQGLADAAAHVTPRPGYTIQVLALISANTNSEVSGKRLLVFHEREA